MKKLALLATLPATVWPLRLHARLPTRWIPQLKEKARRSIDAGLHYLRGPAGRERLAVRLGRDHRAGRCAPSSRAIAATTRPTAPFVTRPGRVSCCRRSTTTARSASRCRTAATTRPSRWWRSRRRRTRSTQGRDRQRPEISQAGHQIDEGEGYKQDHRYYGGVGYGGDERPDMSNLYLAIEGLKASATGPQGPGVAEGRWCS